MRLKLEGNSACTRNRVWVVQLMVQISIKKKHLDKICPKFSMGLVYIYIYPTKKPYISSTRINVDYKYTIFTWRIIHSGSHRNITFTKSADPNSQPLVPAWFLRRRAAWFHRGRRWRVSEAKMFFWPTAAAEWRWTRNLKLNSNFFAPESMMGFQVRSSSEFGKGVYFFWCELLVSGRVLFMYRDCVMWVFRFV